MIERNFDVPFIARLALREKQIQQNYRPIIAVHKWFARRPGTLFRGLLLSEFAPAPLVNSFYESHSIKDVRIGDPFMGGGTPLLEANRMGCEVVGFDINPMAYWIVKEEIEHIDLDAYRQAAEALRSHLEAEIGPWYRSRCARCGSSAARVKYFLWVKVQACRGCGQKIDLFPGYLLAEDRRHPKNVFVCPGCGELVESSSRNQPGDCPSCGSPVPSIGPARRANFTCPSCSMENRYPSPEAGPPEHRLFAIEYFCPECKPGHQGRFFKKPDGCDVEAAEEAQRRWENMRPRFVPDDDIPAGDETNRLHRWGYFKYRQMFNARQLVALELSCREIAKQSDRRLRNALATNLSDLLRYQNMLCRYDPMALKSLDIFSVHGFPVGLVQCESNILGITTGATGVNVGSGGWSNIAGKYLKAKAYCDSPFEIRHEGRRKITVSIRGEWIGEHSNAVPRAADRKVSLACRNAARAVLPAASLDAVLTDPPYFGNVQYAELMDFCYVWLRALLGSDESAFAPESTRNTEELTGNQSMGRGLEEFASGLSAVFQNMTRALKPGGPLAFTYHHNTIEAYLAAAVAILDAGLVCSASLPCPAEMGASIHISGTGSSIVDTVFVCRSTGSVPRKWIAQTPEELAGLVRQDVLCLSDAGLTPSAGDIRCTTFGHITRLAVWNLYKSWDPGRQMVRKLEAVRDWMERTLPMAATSSAVADLLAGEPTVRVLALREEVAHYGTGDDTVSF